MKYLCVYIQYTNICVEREDGDIYGSEIVQWNNWIKYRNTSMFILECDTWLKRYFKSVRKCWICEKLLTVEKNSRYIQLNFKWIKCPNVNILNHYKNVGDIFIGFLGEKVY